MPKGSNLGEFQQLVLWALVRLGGEAYGMQVRRELQARLTRGVSIGAVYSTLDRLEGKGMVRSYHGEPTPERGGRSKRYFEITAQGQSALQESQKVLRQIGFLQPQQART